MNIIIISDIRWHVTNNKKFNKNISKQKNK